MEITIVEIHSKGASHIPVVTCNIYNYSSSMTEWEMPHVFATLQGEKIRGWLPSPNISMEDLLPLSPQFASLHFTDEDHNS